ncbi:MAG TPA: glycosyltransferase family 9 protein [Prosthecobacter sp.]|nr:glycosyltransferase family 9 protein [Prosthecobacter sp.]
MDTLFIKDLVSQAALEIGAAQQPESVGEGRGIVICAGGTSYFANAWILVQLLRHHGCELPIELWAFDEQEFDGAMQMLAKKIGASVRFAGPNLRLQCAKEVPGRWQWVLKPYSILHSSFEEVLYLDADSFPVRDPSSLFESHTYRAEGCVFWPDLGITEASRPIWEVMGIAYRPEPEFETGQMVIDKRRCREPLQLALWMYQHAGIFYSMIWGDKDTFRFAWHKFGRSFGMVPFPVQTLSFPGHLESIATMCQHDFDGNWLFQHRNMAKWNLLEKNPRIPGYLFEKESREFLWQLRSQWHGRLSQVNCPDAVPSSKPAKGAEVIRREVQAGVWLLEDRRPRLDVEGRAEIKWTAERTPEPWFEEFVQVARTDQELRYPELSFLSDSVGKGACKDFYWWDIRVGEGGKGWSLNFIGEKGITASLSRQEDGSWAGCWKPSNADEASEVVRLFRPRHLYPEKQMRSSRKSAVRVETEEPLHVANCALGIGDAITGLYSVAGIAKSGVPVVYHTRHVEWLERVSAPGLTITGAEPPQSSADLNADYEEQLRYGLDKARWYGSLALGKDQRFHHGAQQPRGIAVPAFRPRRPDIDYSLDGEVLDFQRYILLAPCSLQEAREWPEAHWRRLANLLIEAGYEVVAIGANKDQEKLKRTFEKSSAYWVLGQSPSWTSAAMLAAECVIGVDSGMVHMAGLLGVPAICIHAHLPPEFLFSMAPSVVSVAPETECRFCRWQEDRGYNDGCTSSCSALFTVSPERVKNVLAAMPLAKMRSERDRKIDRDTRRKEALAKPATERLTIRHIEADVIAYTCAPDCGLGEAAIMNIAAMEAAGLSVEQRRWEKIILREPGLSDPEQIYYHHWHPQPDEIHRDWHLAGFPIASGARHIAYWAYEAEGALPAEFINLAGVMSEIWTPSTFCQRLFKVTGLPTHVVPHAVPVVSGLAHLPCQNGKAPFTVLYLFDAWSRFTRKNPTAAVRVFQRTFRFRHDVRLILKGHHMSPEELLQLKASTGFDSRITIVNRYLTSAELDELFDSADVLLSLQRGEGFGLNIAKALGRGLPVITTGWGGQLDFCRPENAMLVPYRLVNAGSGCEDHRFSNGVWAEPNETAACHMLARMEQMAAAGDKVLLEMRENGLKMINSKFSHPVLYRNVFNCINGPRKSKLD